MDCIFCKIIKGEIPSYTIYEDEYVKCFLDINPNCKAHTLVIPKKHFLDNNDIDNEYLIKIHEASKKVIDIISKTYKVTGYRLVQNNGILQEVKHYHLHVLPSYEDDTNESVEEVYNKLKKNC